ISISMGTSTGTVVALAPIAVGIADQTEIGLALALATVIGGAMFGDNLSVISDTTIVATQSQEVRMVDKFKTNFFIILPGAIATAVILYFISTGFSTNVSEWLEYVLIKVIWFHSVIVIAVLGANARIVLSSGTVPLLTTGIIEGTNTFVWFTGVSDAGIAGMRDISTIAILIGRMIGLIEHYGGK